LIIKNDLVKIFNKNIQRLDIDWYYDFEQLTLIIYHYFSNVQFIYFSIGEVSSGLKQRADLIMEILNNFKK